MFQRPREEPLHWADVHEDGGFTLYGHKYDRRERADGVPKMPGGSKTQVAFLGPGPRDNPIQFGNGSSRTRRLVHNPFKILAAISQWHQSNYSQKQNALGGLVSESKYTMDPSIVTKWPLPTSYDPEILHPGLKAYGLVQYSDGMDEVYASMWPKKSENEGNKIQVCAGAWNVSNKEQIWENLEGNFYIPEDAYENQVYPFYSMFHTTVGNWLFMITNEITSGGYQVHRVYSTNRARQFIPVSSLNLYTCNASVHAWEETVEGVSSNKFYIFLPFFMPIDGEYPGEGEPNPFGVVNFFNLNESTGYWTREATRTIATLPDGGAEVIPSLIGTGVNFTGSFSGPPSAWLGQEALIFVSGGKRLAAETGTPISDSCKWEKIHWTIRSLKPADGTDGAFVQSKSVDATDSPILLDPGSMIAEVNSVPELIYFRNDVFKSGTKISASTSDDYKHFARLCPIILPVERPNMGRLETIESRMASDRNGTVQWPGLLKNIGGGLVVDEANTVWSVILEPVQCLYGGYYTIEDNGTHDRTVWTIWATYHEGALEFAQVEGFPYPTITFPPTKVMLSIIEYPDSVTQYGDTVISDSAPTLPDDTLYNSWSEVRWVYDIYGNLNGAYHFRYLRSTTYSTTSEGVPYPYYERVWNQYHGLLMRTILRGHRADAEKTIVEVDISQKINATTRMYLGDSGYIGPSPNFRGVTVTQLELELADNVHQIISFADKNLVAILRDLHLDGANNNPTPAIEIWEVTSTSAEKASTIRLGSYDEKCFEDLYFPDYDILAGDQEWDPYKFGPPRMKACRKLGTDNTPIIVAMVGESKKVDTETQSQFKRVCYATIKLDIPQAPEVTRSARTSEDLGIGSSGEPTGTDFHAPIWDSWDTLVLTPAGVAWIKDSEFREL